MKTAKLFVHGSEYCDLNYPVESDIRAAIDNELSNMETLDHIPQRACATPTKATAMHWPKATPTPAAT